LISPDVSLDDPRLQLDPSEWPRNTTASIIAAWREICRRQEMIKRENLLARKTISKRVEPIVEQETGDKDRRNFELSKPLVPVSEAQPSVSRESSIPRSRKNSGSITHSRQPSIRRQNSTSVAPGTPLRRSARLQNLPVEPLTADVTRKRRTKSHSGQGLLSVQTREAVERSRTRNTTLPPQVRKTESNVSLPQSKSLVTKRSFGYLDHSPLNITPERRKRTGFFSAWDEDLENVKVNNDFNNIPAFKKSKALDGSATPVKFKSQEWKSRAPPLTDSPALLALRAQREAEREFARQEEEKRRLAVKDITLRENEEAKRVLSNTNKVII
jgi:hypothetical protein